MHLYGLIIGISILIGLNYFSRHQRLILPKQQKIFLIGLITSAIIGARIYHVIEQWSYYSQHLSQIPATWNGGLSILGALLASNIFIFLFSLAYRLSFIALLDLITPILPLCQAVGRLGNFVNHENPTWWQEAIPDFCLFLILKISPNKPTAKYLIGYGLIRFVTEFARTDTWIYGSIKIGQVVAIIFIIVGLTLWTVSRKP